MVRGGGGGPSCCSAIFSSLFMISAKYCVVASAMRRALSSISARESRIAMARMRSVCSLERPGAWRVNSKRASVRASTDAPEAGTSIPRLVSSVLAVASLVTLEVIKGSEMSSGIDLFEGRKY
jgi:hypothetical protein